MEIIECASLILLFGLCIITTASDIKYGIIQNRVLIWFLIPSLFLDVLYYGIIARDLFTLFLANVFALATIALVLFYTYSFAGGDCKLAITMGLIFPANYYLSYGNSAVTLFFTIGFAILYGYIFMLITSIVNLIQRKSKLTAKYIGDYLKSFIVSFVSALAYICLLNLVFTIIGRFVFVNDWIIRIICMITTWMVGKLSAMRKWYVVVPIIIIDIVVGTIMQTMPFSINPENYVLVVILLICQMAIRASIYEDVKIEDVKKGMILSMASTIPMQNSRFKGMPGISTEDLRSRLTTDEVESIKRWGKSRNITKVTVMKKIPFAVFLSMGFLSYFVLGIVIV